MQYVDEVDVKRNSHIDQCTLYVVSDDCDGDVKQSHSGWNGNPFELLISESDRRGSVVADNCRYGFRQLFGDHVGRNLDLFMASNNFWWCFREVVIISKMEILVGIMERCCKRSYSLSGSMFVGLLSLWTFGGLGLLAVGCSVGKTLPDLRGA